MLSKCPVQHRKNRPLHNTLALDVDTVQGEDKEIIRKEIDTDKGRGQQKHKVTIPKKVEVSSGKQSMRFKTERPGSLAS